MVMKKHNEKDLQEELQKLYLQQQMIKHHISAYSEQSEVIDAKIKETSSTIDAVGAINDLKKGSETLANLGSDVFLSSAVSDADNVIINIGSGIFKKKKIEDVLKMLEKKREELMNLNTQITSEIAALNMRLHEVEPEMQKIAQRLQE